MTCCFIIFAHNYEQNNEDVQDMIDNINFYHKNCDIVVNHPTLTHSKVSVRHRLGPVDHSTFMFGAFSEVFKSFEDSYVKQFDHFCLVSANQYFINNISFDKGVNYLQFLNHERWEDVYSGKDFDRTIVGNPIIQPWGNWDELNSYLEYGIQKPMAANWECATFTQETIFLVRKHIDRCLELFPNKDRINTFPGYMALLSGQEWRFPPHFGTYDASNPNPKNWIITIDQLSQKYSDGYFSIKRVNYSKFCPIKEFIRNNIMI